MISRLQVGGTKSSPVAANAKTTTKSDTKTPGSNKQPLGVKQQQQTTTTTTMKTDTKPETKPETKPSVPTNDGSYEDDSDLWDIFLTDYYFTKKFETMGPAGKIKNLFKKFTNKVMNLGKKFGPDLKGLQSLFKNFMQKQKGGAVSKKDINTLSEEFKLTGYKMMKSFLYSQKIKIDPFTMKIIKYFYINKFDIDYIKKVNYLMYVMNKNKLNDDFRNFLQKLFDTLTTQINIHFKV
jgi:hypothetical protein